MVKEIIKDTDFLSIKCTRATKEDFHIIADLIDTANHYKPNCCGLASNQIGYNKRIAVVFNGSQWVVLINPVIVVHSTPKHESEEGCMSLDGIRKVERYDKIEVMCENTKGKTNRVNFRGLLADIVQHEIDHLNGKLI